MAPIERRGQEKYEAVFEEIRRSGFVRMRVDGKSFNIDAPPQIDRRRKHLIEVVIDRLIARKNRAADLVDAVGLACSIWVQGGDASCRPYVDDARGSRNGRFDCHSQHFACDQCGRRGRAVEPASFFVQQCALPQLVPRL